MNYRFSETIDSFKSSAVREILKLTQGRSIISLAGGLPNEQYFPLDAVRDAFARVFEQGNSVLQYGLTEGFTPLRESISKHLARKGIHAGIDNMLLTTGSQQAIDLLTKIYVDPGDVILVEKPTYLAAIQVFQSHKARLVSVDCDTDGMNPEDLERKIKLHQPKFVYVIPTFANPTGKAWSIERRQHTLDICKRNNVLILEDDPYGELRFGKGEPLLPSSRWAARRTAIRSFTRAPSPKSSPLRCVPAGSSAIKKSSAIWRALNKRPTCIRAPWTSRRSTKFSKASTFTVTLI